MTGEPAGEPRDAAVQVSGLRKTYAGKVEALRGIDLRIRRGEIFGLIGPNGAGKSTLIRTLVGALRPTEGSVAVLGLDPLADRWELRRRIGYMPQEPALYEDLSARRNIEFFAAAHPVEGLRDLVADALELVDLVDRAQDPVRTLSGGMKQRVSLACALAHRPDLLFLDEPTSGVDPELRASFWASFRDLARRGVTVIVSTHQMPEALECDRVAVLRQGRVLVSEDPRVLAASGTTTVRIRRGDAVETHIVDDYRHELAPLLCSGPPADEVELIPETMEQIVLRLIRDGADAPA